MEPEKRILLVPLMIRDLPSYPTSSSIVEEEETTIPNNITITVDKPDITAFFIFKDLKKHTLLVSQSIEDIIHACIYTF